MGRVYLATQQQRALGVELDDLGELKGAKFQFNLELVAPNSFRVQAYVVTKAGAFPLKVSRYPVTLAIGDTAQLTSDLQEAAYIAKYHKCLQRLWDTGIIFYEGGMLRALHRFSHKRIMRRLRKAFQVPVK